MRHSLLKFSAFIFVFITANLLFAQVVFAQAVNDPVLDGSVGSTGGISGGATKAKQPTTTKSTTTKSTSGSTTTSTPASTSAGTTTPATGSTEAISGEASIDTSVTVTPGAGFDTPLGTFYNPLDFKRPEELVVRVINALLLLVGIISIIMIIVGGLRMVASGGSETSITKGKQTIIWAVGGLLVSLLSFSIVAIIQSIIS